MKKPPQYKSIIASDFTTVGSVNPHVCRLGLRNHHHDRGPVSIGLDCQLAKSKTKVMVPVQLKMAVIFVDS